MPVEAELLFDPTLDVAGAVQHPPADSGATRPGAGRSPVPDRRNRSAEAIRDLFTGQKPVHALHRRKQEEFERQSADYLARVRKVKQPAEEQLREAGGRQDEQGRWWWKDEPIALEVSPVILMAQSSTFMAGSASTDVAVSITADGVLEKNPDGER